MTQEERKIYRKNYYQLNKERLLKQCSLWRKTNRIKINEYRRNNYAKNKEFYREGELRRLYSLSLEDYENLRVQQNFSCAICLKSEKSFSKALAVDHEHATGKIRGLLCHICNTKLSSLENIAWMSAAIKYLKWGKK